MVSSGIMEKDVSVLESMLSLPQRSHPFSSHSDILHFHISFSTPLSPSSAMWAHGHYTLMLPPFLSQPAGTSSTSSTLLPPPKFRLAVGSPDPGSHPILLLLPLVLLAASAPAVGSSVLSGVWVGVQIRTELSGSSQPHKLLKVIRAFSTWKRGISGGKKENVQRKVGGLVNLYFQASHGFPS